MAPPPPRPPQPRIGRRPPAAARSRDWRSAWRLLAIVSGSSRSVPGLFAPQSPLAVNVDQALEPPSAAHLFGTDDVGRDVFARVVHGARVTLSICAGALVLSALVGGALGLISGFFGGAHRHGARAHRRRDPELPARHSRHHGHRHPRAEDREPRVRARDRLHAGLLPHRPLRGAVGGRADLCRGGPQHRPVGGRRSCTGTCCAMCCRSSSCST